MKASSALSCQFVTLVNQRTQHFAVASRALQWERCYASAAVQHHLTQRLTVHLACVGQSICLLFAGTLMLTAPGSSGDLAALQRLLASLPQLHRLKLLVPWVGRLTAGRGEIVRLMIPRRAAALFVQIRSRVPEGHHQHIGTHFDCRCNRVACC
jgi:hypothetical protein